MITVNNEAIEMFDFPGGEVQVKLPPKLSPPFKVRARFQHPSMLMIIALVDDALIRQYGQGIGNLVIPYMPYARQDRVCSVGESIAAQAFVQALRGITKAPVVTWDLHSNVEYYNRFNITEARTFAYEWRLEGLGDNSECVLVSPDAGAFNKVLQVSSGSVLHRRYPLIQCSKNRDPQTGTLSGFSITKGEGLVEGKDLWILDDICDGGGTFIGLAEELKKHNPRSINLYTTHGIYSKGLDELCKVFNKVVSTNTFDHGITEVPDNYIQLKAVENV